MSLLVVHGSWKYCIAYTDIHSMFAWISAAISALETLFVFEAYSLETILLTNSKNVSDFGRPLNTGI